jgi:hypothetical protein
MSGTAIRPISELAGAINQEHELFEKAARSAVTHVQRAGGLLRDDPRLARQAIGAPA